MLFKERLLLNKCLTLVQYCTSVRHLFMLLAYTLFYFLPGFEEQLLWQLPQFPLQPPHPQLQAFPDFLSL